MQPSWLVEDTLLQPSSSVMESTDVQLWQLLNPDTHCIEKRYGATWYDITFVKSWIVLIVLISFRTTSIKKYYWSTMTCKQCILMPIVYWNAKESICKCFLHRYSFALQCLSAQTAQQVWYISRSKDWFFLHSHMNRSEWWLNWFDSIKLNHELLLLCCV